MSTTIDERVVGLKFDNDQFEKNVKQSMNTLDDLDKQLGKSGSSKGFSSFSSAVDTAEGSLSSLFQTASQYITQGIFLKLGSQIEEMGIKLVKSLSVDQLSSGFSKYEEYTTGIQTILSAVAEKGKDLEDVTVVMDKLTWYADETSASLTDMVNSIGKFASNGVDLDKATTAIEGISNWAYYSGQNIEAASRAMYNLSQAMGVGAVRVTDWSSIETANMATESFKEQVLETAAALGTLQKVGEKYYLTEKEISDETEVTTANFRSMLSKNFFTTDVLVEVLSKYANATDRINQIFNEVNESGEILTADLIKLAEAYDGDTEALRGQLEELGVATDVIDNVIDEFEYFTTEEGKFGIKTLEAAQSTKTLTEAISSVKDAVSTGWMKSFEIIIGNLEQAKDRLSELTENLWTIFNGGAEIRNNWLSEVFGTSGASKLSAALEKCGVEADSFYASLLKIAQQDGVMIDLDDSTKKVVETFEELQTAFQQGSLTIDHIKEALSTFLDSGGYTFSSTIEGVEEATDAFEILRAVALDTLHGDYGNGAERVEALTQMGYDAEIVQRMMDIAYGKMEQGGASTTEELKRLTKEETDYVAALYGKTNDWENAVQNVSEASQALEAAGVTGESQSNLKEFIDNLGYAESEQAELIANMFQMSGAELLWGSVNNVLSAIATTLTGLRSAFNDVFGDPLARGVKGLLQNLWLVTTRISEIVEQADGFKEQFTAIFMIVRSVLSFIKTAIGTIISTAKDLFSSFMEGLGATDISLLDVSARISAWIYKLRDALQNSELLKSIVNDLKTAITYLGKGIKYLVDQFENLINSDSEFSQKFRSLLDSIKNGTFTIDSLWDLLKSFFEWLQSTVKGAGGSVIATLSNSVEGETSLIQQIFQGFVDKISGILGGIIGIFANIFGGGGDVLDTLGGFATKVKDVIVSIFQDDGTISGIVANSGIAALAVFLINLAGVASSLMAPLKAAGSLIDLVAKGLSGMITGVGKALKGVIKSYKADISANMFLKLASAVLILVAAMLLLTKIPTDQLWTTVGVIAALSGILAAIMLAMTALLSKGDIAKKFMMLGAMFAGIGVALIALAVSIKSLSNIKGNDLAKVLITIVAFMIGMKALMSTFKGMSFAGIDIKSAAGFFIEMVAVFVGMFAMIKVLKVLTDVDFGTIIVGLLKMAILVAAIYGLFAIIGTGDSVVVKAGVSILALSAGVLLLVVAMQAIKKFKWGELGKSLLIVTALAAIIAGLILVMRIAGVYKSDAGKNILGISAGMLILVAVVKALNKVGYQEFVEGYECLLLLTLVVAALIFVSQYAGDVKGTPILQMAVLLSATMIAILALRAVVKNDIESTIEATIVILVMVMALALIIKSTEKLSADGSKTIWALTGLITAIAAMIAITIVVLRHAEDLDTPRIVIYAFTALLGAISGVLVAISKLSKADNFSLKDIGRYVLIMVAVISLVAATVALLTALSKTAITKGVFLTVVALGTLVATIGGVVAGLGYVFGSVDFDIEDLGSAIGLFIAVALIASWVADIILPALSGLKTQVGSFKEMETYILYLAEIMAVLAGVTSLVAVAIGKTNGQLTVEAAKAFALILLALLVALVACAGIAAGMNAWMPEIKTNMVSKILATGILLAAVSMLAMVVATSLGKIQGTGLTKEAVSNYASLLKYLVIALVAVSLIVAGINEIKINNGIMTKVIAVAGMTAAITELALLLGKQISHIRFAPTIKKKLGIFALLVTVVAVIAAVSTGLIALINLIPTVNKGLLTKVAAVAAMTAVIGTVALLISKSVSNIQSISLEQAGILVAAVLLVCAIAGAAIGLIALVNQVEINDGLLTKIEAISILILVIGALSVSIAAVSGALAPVMAIPGMFVAALLAVGEILITIALVVAVFAGIAAILDALDDGDLKARLDNGFDILSTIMLGIGEAIGDVLSGIGVGLADGLVLLGDKFVSFSEKMQEFAENIGGIGADAARGAAYIAEAIISMAGAEVIESVSSFFSLFKGKNGADTFSTSLNKLGSGIKSFVTGMGDVTDDQIGRIGKASEVLLDLVDVLKQIPREGGVSGFFAGNRDIETFADSFVKLADGLVKMSTSMKDVSLGDLGKMSLAVDQLKKLAEVDASLGNHGNIADNLSEEYLGFSFTGDQTLNDFLDMLVGTNGEGGVIDKLVLYGQKATKLNSYTDETGKTVDLIDGIKSSVTALSELSAIDADLEDHGGLFGAIGGDQSLGNLGTNLDALGDGLSNYAEKTKDISADTIKDSLSAIIALGNVESGLSAVGDSAKTMFSGSQNLGDLGDNLKKLGEAISAFYEEVGSITQEEYDRIVSYAAGIAVLEGNISTAYNNVGDAGVKAAVEGADNAAKDAEEEAKKIANDSVTAAEEAAVTKAKSAGKATGEAAGEAAAESTISAATSYIEDNSDKIAAVVDVIGPKLSALGLNTDQLQDVANIFLQLAEGETTAAEATQLITDKCAEFGITIPSWLPLETIVNTLLPTLQEKLGGVAGALDTVTEASDNTAESAETTTQSIDTLKQMLAEAMGVDVSTFENMDLSQLQNLASMFSSGSGATASEKVEAVATSASDIATAVGEANPQLQAYTETLSSFCDTVQSINDADLPTTAENIESLGDAFAHCIEATNLTDEQKEAINENSSAIVNLLSEGIVTYGEMSEAGTLTPETAISELISGALSVDTLEEAHQKEAEIAGSKMVEWIAAAISSRTDITDETLAAAQSAANKIQTNEDNNKAFYKAGGYVVTGFVNGILANLYKATNAGTKLGKAASDAARASLSIRSPSRVFMEIGAYVAEGFAIGIEDNSKVAYKSAESMGDYAISGLEDAMSSVDRIINDEDYGNPTITPVLDLSNIQSGTAQMRSMINSAGGTIGINSGVTTQLAGNVKTTFDEGSEDMILATLQDIENRIPSGIQNADGTSGMVVSLDEKSMAALSRSSTSASNLDINVTYTGSLSYLAKILQPEIQAEANRRGKSLINS